MASPESGKGLGNPAVLDDCMSKEINLYACANCDAQFPKWSGRCSECGAWGQIMAAAGTGNQSVAKPSKIINLQQLSDQQTTRLTTGLPEIDRVFGGGIVNGSLSLLGGEPGIGKSTLVAQIADAVSHQHNVLYVSGEESGTQVKLRLTRLGCDLKRLNFIADVDIAAIATAARSLKPALLIIDSIQTMVSHYLPAEAGNLNQIRASAVEFLNLAKNADIATILIGHITKDGSLAGPKSLEHLVDTVLYLETDPSLAYRFLRATKNRFGSTNELGVFTMTEAGLEAVANPTGLFLEKNNRLNFGSVVGAITEGSRPFLVEIQALVSKTVFGYPIRRSAGFDQNRLQILTAVLTKRGSLNLTAADVIVNIVGGLKSADPGLDLAVCLAIASSWKNISLPPGLVAVGEVGLSGEIRSAARLEEKLQAARQLNFQRAVVSAQTKLPKIPDVDLIKVRDLTEALALLQ